MKQIEVKCLNPEQIQEAIKMQAFAAKFTQQGHNIQTMKDFEDALANTKPSEKFTQALTDLQHNTLRQFNMITIAVVGISRRFLAQITRRRVGVTFMSSSLQYSDYSNAAQFVIPYEMVNSPDSAAKYENACLESFETYKELVKKVGRDAAGYAMPQSLRGALIISATPQAWAETLSQRICKRNTSETRYTCLLIAKELYMNSKDFIKFLPPCAYGKKCPENKMSCKNPYILKTPEEILREDFPLLCQE